MKGNELLDKMELIAPEYIEAAEVLPEKNKIKSFKPWIKWAVAAFAVVISVAALVVLFAPTPSSPTDDYSHNIYDPETERRAQPLDESLIEKLVEMGVDKETASKMTVGEYEDYMSSLQADNEHSSQPEDYSSSSDGSSDRTNHGAEDNTGEKHYTAAQLEKINALGLTFDDVKTLNDMGFTVEDIVGMTKEKASRLLTTNAAEWDCCLTFSYSGYDYHKPAENVSACFADTDWSWAFDGISAYLEENGKPVTGLINDGIKYKLVIKLKLDHKLDKYYGFSYVPKKQVKLYTKDQSSLSAKEFYSDGEYLIAKFELEKISLTYSVIEFVQEGYALGADAGSISVISNTEGIEMYQPLVTVYDEATGRKKNYSGNLEENVEYGLMITFFVPDGYDVDTHAEVSLFGFGKKPLKSDGVVSQLVGWANGRDMYACYFVLPVL